ncbi:universal stress protein [Nakamurella silvestris]|nr:universal stress protein [Nakamurella silvestris]
MTTAAEPGVTVGLDGTDAAHQALLWAVDEADLRQVPLRLLHGYTPPVLAGAGTAAVIDAQEHWAAEILEEARQAAKSLRPGLEVTAEVGMQPAAVLLNHASADARLTVVGTRGRGQLTASLFGSVSMRTAGHVQGAVLIVRAEQTVPERDAAQVVILCADGSAGSDQAAAFAFEEATLRRASVVAVRSWDDMPLRQGLRAYPLEVNLNEVDQAEAAELEKQLVPFAQRYPQVPLRRIVVRGRPTEAIMSYVEEHHASDHPIVVVGSRGRGGFAGLMLGSTSQSLIAHSSWPTVVVSTGPAAADAER